MFEVTENATDIIKKVLRDRKEASLPIRIILTGG
jgi:Fe-S cluster assembly iron-binding protein IscA